MKKYMISAIAILLIGCSQNRSSGLHKTSLVTEISAKNGLKIAEIIGITNFDEYYSKIYIVTQADTLLVIDSSGVHNSNEMFIETSTEDYDGWRIKSLGSDGIEIWLARKDGPSSDGAMIQWIDSKKNFILSWPGAEILIPK